MSRYSRNRKRLRQVEGRRAVIETILLDKKISHIDLSNKTEGSQIDLIMELASQKKIKINFVDKKSIEKKSSTKKSQGIILYIDDNYQSSVEEMIFLADKRKEPPFLVLSLIHI